VPIGAGWPASLFDRGCWLRRPTVSHLRSSRGWTHSPNPAPTVYRHAGRAEVYPQWKKFSKRFFGRKKRWAFKLTL